MNLSKEDLETYKIPSIPSTIYYIPSFLSTSEETTILSSLPPSRWIHLSHRRLQAHPSTLSKTNTLLASPLPKYLTDPILPRFQNLDLFETSPHGTANHVLINEYRAGEGIMPHEDGGAYSPIVATVSLGASIVLDIYDKRDENEDTIPRSRTPRYRILQEPRSLLITIGTAYTDLLHGIADVDVDEGLSADTVANWELLGDAEAVVKQGGKNVRGVRTSLTYRDVLKVSKVGSRILGKSRG